ncbi:MAG: hypothetical protein COB14_01935 [Alphaproteobacteria bacterium]|nr:MAG: hypothetical protein COB14_01935 [Alphaproteobacteria bacterium]
MGYDVDVIDLDMLKQVQTLLKERWPELVDGYLESATTYIDNIKNGLVDGDAHVVSSNAHPLKSSSSGIGIVSVGEIAGAIEDGAKGAIENGADMSHLDDLVLLLDDAFQRAVPRLRATVGECASV